MRQDMPRILIIDDNATNLSVLTEYLESSDFQIMVARNGAAGIDKARPTGFDSAGYSDAGHGWLRNLSALKSGSGHAEVTRHIGLDTLFR